LKYCPENVKILHCEDNQLKSLEGCPPNIVSLYINNNHIMKMNVYLPDLTKVEFYNNPLISPWNRYDPDEMLLVLNTPPINNI